MPKISVRRGFLRQLIEVYPERVRHGDVICDKAGIPLRNHKRIPPTGYDPPTGRQLQAQITLAKIKSEKTPVAL